MHRKQCFLGDQAKNHFTFSVSFSWLRMILATFFPCHFIWKQNKLICDCLAATANYNHSAEVNEALKTNRMSLKKRKIVYFIETFRFCFGAFLGSNTSKTPSDKLAVTSSAFISSGKSTTL